MSLEIFKGGKPLSFWVTTWSSSHTVPLIMVGLYHSLMYFFLCSQNFEEAAMPKTTCRSSVGGGGGGGCGGCDCEMLLGMAVREERRVVEKGTLL